MNATLANPELDYLGIGLLRLDEKLEIVYVNDQAVFLLACNHESRLVGSKLSDLDQIFSEALDSVLGDVLRRGGSERVHAGIEQPTGKISHVRLTVYSAAQTANATPVSVLIQVVDDEVKRESETYWKGILLDQVGDYVYAKDSDGHLVYANSAFRSNYVATDDYVEHPDRPSVIPTRQAVYSDALAQLANEGEWSGYLRRKGMDGEVSVLKCNWVTVESRYYSSGITVCDERDVSVEVERESHRLKQARLDDVGLMMSGMVHDLNNILGPATLASDMLADQYPDDDMIEIVVDGLHSARGINANIRNYLDGIELTPKWVDVGTLIKKVHDALDQILSDEVELRIDVDEDSGRCYFVEIYLRRVLFNLLANASEAVGGKGWIHISAYHASLSSCMADPFIELATSPKSGTECVVIDVSDSGHGIPRERANHVVEAYYTTKESGSGLGLSICCNLMRKMNGSLLLKPSGAPGATFRVLLPCD